MRGWMMFIGSAAFIGGLSTAAMVGATLIGQARHHDNIAFLGEENNNYEIYLADVVTGVTVNLTRDPLQDVSFTWSKTGEMAFVSNRSGRDTLYLMTSQSQSVRRIDTVVAPFAPSWSPDGEKIAFMGNPTNGLADIFVMPAAGGVPINITQTSDLSEASISWSPDSTQIVTAALNPPEVKIFAADGSQVKRLTDNGSLPQWSPNGAQVVYRTIRGMAEIRRRDLASDQETTIAAGEGKVAWVQPVWSPSGEAVAFVKQLNNTNLIRVSAITGEENEGRDYVTGVFGIGALAWDAAGTRLVFAAKESQTSAAQNIYVLTLATGDIHQVTTTPAFTSFPSWQPQ